MLKHGETASQSNKQFHVPLLRGAPQNNLHMTIWSKDMYQRDILNPIRLQVNIGWNSKKYNV